MRARFAALFVVASACTFPDITVVVQEESGGGGGSSPTMTNTGGAGGAPSTTSTESTTSSMTTTSSMSTVSSGGGGAGGGECPDVDGDMDPSILCGGTDCDDDEDGVMVEFEGCCVAPGCDCFDGNADVFPGQPGWFSEPWDGVDNYDYDCSLIEEARYTEECPQSNIVSCLDGKVFLGPVGCGGSGNAQTCKGILNLGLGCTPDESNTYSLIQECH